MESDTKITITKGDQTWEVEIDAWALVYQGHVWQMHFDDTSLCPRCRDQVTANKQLDDPTYTREEVLEMLAEQGFI
jgi:hypothetical protein